MSLLSSLIFSPSAGHIHVLQLYQYYNEKNFLKTRTLKIILNLKGVLITAKYINKYLGDINDINFRGTEVTSTDTYTMTII